MIITIIYYPPTAGTANANFSFAIREHNKNAWGTSEQITVQPIASGGGPLTAGVNTFQISIPTANLANLYFSGGGTIQNNPPPPSVFVAEPPAAHVSDEDAFGTWGPPWIALAQLTANSGLSADLFIVNGEDSQAGTAHPYVVGSWAVNM